MLLEFKKKNIAKIGENPGATKEGKVKPFKVSSME